MVSVLRFSIAIIAILLIAQTVVLTLFVFNVTSNIPTRVSGNAVSTVSFCINAPPVIAVIPDMVATVGLPFYLHVIAVDPDNDSIVFGDTSNLFEINGTSGEIQFTPVAGQEGIQEVTVTATDACTSSTKSFRLLIINLNPPAAAPAPAPAAGGGGSGGGWSSSASSQVASSSVASSATAVPIAAISSESKADVTSQQPASGTSIAQSTSGQNGGDALISTSSQTGEQGISTTVPTSVLGIPTSGFATLLERTVGVSSLKSQELSNLIVVFTLGIFFGVVINVVAVYCFLKSKRKW